MSFDPLVQMFRAFVSEGGTTRGTIKLHFSDSGNKKQTMSIKTSKTMAAMNSNRTGNSYTYL